MTPAKRTPTILLLLGLGGCGGRTEVIAGATGNATGGSAGDATFIPAAGGSVLTAGGTNAGGGHASTGSQPSHKTARAVATGSAHTCALLRDGQIECWGRNSSGELGDGTTTARSLPASVQGISDAILVATAFDHTCAIVGNGQVKCWGSNAYGQLGNGTSTDSALPITVPGLSGIIGIDVGGLPAHTCALSNAGRVYCWGNAYLDSSDPDNPKLASPAMVPRLASAVALSVGIGHTCVILSSAAVYCWGSNNYGQLGNGSTDDVAEPAQVPSYSTQAAISLAAGGNDTCAVTADLRVQCWGSNSAGQLGNALVTAGAGFASTLPMTVDQIASASSIAVGSQHSCATLQSGAVQCWGSNSAGELGDGTSNPSPIPITAIGVSGASWVAAGGEHTCAVVDSGRVLCWGSNWFGQLGDGSKNDSPVPVVVAGY